MSHFDVTAFSPENQIRRFVSIDPFTDHYVGHIVFEDESGSKVAYSGRKCQSGADAIAEVRSVFRESLTNANH